MYRILIFRLLLNTVWDIAAQSAYFLEPLLACDDIISNAAATAAAAAAAS